MKRVTFTKSKTLNRPRVTCKIFISAIYKFSSNNTNAGCMTSEPKYHISTVGHKLCHHYIWRYSNIWGESKGDFYHYVQFMSFFTHKSAQRTISAWIQVTDTIEIYKQQFKYLSSYTASRNTIIYSLYGFNCAQTWLHMAPIWINITPHPENWQMQCGHCIQNTNTM